MHMCMCIARVHGMCAWHVCMARVHSVCTACARLHTCGFSFHWQSGSSRQPSISTGAMRTPRACMRCGCVRVLEFGNPTYSTPLLASPTSAAMCLRSASCPNSMSCGETSTSGVLTRASAARSPSPKPCQEPSSLTCTSSLDEGRGRWPQVQPQPQAVQTAP